MIYLQGLIMGLAYVAPIGIQNLFVINTALTNEYKRSLITALIVIFFDVSLAFACFFGIGSLMEHFEWLKVLVLLIGSITVSWIGISLITRKVTPNQQITGSTNKSVVKTIIDSCVVTWFNPQALIDGTVMLGAFHATLSASEGIKFILGVASASCMWFLGITVFITLFKNKFSKEMFRAVNLICGSIIVFYGIKLFIDFVNLI